MELIISPLKSLLYSHSSLILIIFHNTSPLSRFLVRFIAEQPSLSEQGQGKMVHSFIDSIISPSDDSDIAPPLVVVSPTTLSKLASLSLWVEDDEDRIGECLEKYIMLQLYSK